MTGPGRAAGREKSSTSDLASLADRTNWPRIFQFLFAFGCIFAAFALPSRGFGPLYTRAHTAIGNVIVGDRPTAAGARLHFHAGEADLTANPWRTTLRVDAPGRQSASFPIDLRSLAFLPTAAFIALAVAVPLARRRDNVLVLLLGLGLLGPLELLLMALPVLSLLGGDGPIDAFSLSVPLRVIINVAYRALVAPPGMIYAIPLLLLWLLVAALKSRSPPPMVKTR